MTVQAVQFLNRWRGYSPAKNKFVQSLLPPAAAPVGAAFNSRYNGYDSNVVAGVWICHLTRMSTGFTRPAARLSLSMPVVL